jgi:hypothetical protein
LKKQLEEDQLERWDDYLMFSQFYINIRIHELFDQTPFYLFYGRQPNYLQDYTGTSVNEKELYDLEKVQKKWEILAKTLYPNILEMVKVKHDVSNVKRDKKNRIHQFKIGDVCMYLKRESVDKKIGSGKMNPIYAGPMTIMQTNSSGHFRGIDHSTNGNTRVLPPTHLKLFAEMRKVKEEYKEKNKETAYLVEYSNGEEDLVEKSYIPKSLLNDFKIRERLQQTEGRIEETKNRKEDLRQKQIQLTEEIEKKKKELELLSNQE